MDMATIFGRYERANGRLEDMAFDEIMLAQQIEVDVTCKSKKLRLLCSNRNAQPPNEIETERLL